MRCAAWGGVGGEQLIDSAAIAAIAAERRRMQQRGAVVGAAHTGWVNY